MQLQMPQSEGRTYKCNCTFLFLYYYYCTVCVSEKSKTNELWVKFGASASRIPKRSLLNLVCLCKKVDTFVLNNHLIRRREHRTMYICLVSNH